MATHLFPLLGGVNASVQKKFAVRPKYVVKLTAEKISELLQYDRKGDGKSAPFKIKVSSAIKIDEEIQRGVDEAGYLAQQPSKISDIARTLLGDTGAEKYHAYLGTLVWNIRSPNGKLSVNVLSQAPVNGVQHPPEYMLRIDTDSIYLTDSAHRHFGIAEAVRIYKLEPGKYDRFSPDVEFAVEIYNLDKSGERDLFTELNGKQKKVSPSKIKSLDTTSPVGSLRQAILTADANDRSLLKENIEKKSVQSKFELMTMSVFTETINEVFSLEELKASRESEETQQEYAGYYCDFLYKLSDTIRVSVRFDGETEDKEVNPYENLYQKYIEPAWDKFDDASPAASEANIGEAYAAAVLYSNSVRKVDISNNNAVMKAVFRLGGRVRHMKEWRSVIDRLQNELINSKDGKFFQKDNQELFSSDGASGDVPIASMNSDNSINVQVQTKVISKIYSYISRLLSLDLPVHFYANSSSVRVEFSNEIPYLWVANSDTDSVKTIYLSYLTLQAWGEEFVPELSVDSEWSAAKFKGQKKLKATTVRKDNSYEHDHYPEFFKYVASFEIKIPPLPSPCDLDLSVHTPDISGETIRCKAKIKLELAG